VVGRLVAEAHPEKITTMSDLTYCSEDCGPTGSRRTCGRAWKRFAGRSG